MTMPRVDRLRRRNGSFALETAIALPGFILVATVLLTGMAASRIGVHVDMALEGMCRSISLGGPAADFIGVDRLGDVLDSIGEKDSRSILDGLDLSGLKDLLVCGAADLALPFLFETEYNAAPSRSGVDGMIIGAGNERWKVECESRLSDEMVRITMVYALRTPFGLIERRASCFLSLWEEGDGTRDAREGENVWSLDKLVRGRTLRARFGGNLPMGFPVLSAFRNGTATVIHSMDLSAMGWQDVVEAEREIVERIDALVGFNGTLSPWGSDGINIAPGTIQARHFLLVVPTNTDEDRFASILDRCTLLASRKGAVMSVVRYQERLAAVAME